MIRLRLGLGVAGILLALAGIGFDSRTIVWAAIGLLGLSVLLRVLQRFRSGHGEPPAR